jgi:hypothetical protein
MRVTSLHVLPSLKMNTVVMLPPLQCVPEVVTAQATAQAAGEPVYVDYVLPGYDYTFNVLIADYNITVPYMIKHPRKVVKLTLEQAIAHEQGMFRIRIPYSATQFSVMVPHTGEIRYCSMDAYAIEL